MPLRSRRAAEVQNPQVLSHRRSRSRKGKPEDWIRAAAEAFSLIQYHTQDALVLRKIDLPLIYWSQRVLHLGNFKNSCYKYYIFIKEIAQQLQWSRRNFFFVMYLA